MIDKYVRVSDFGENDDKGTTSTKKNTSTNLQEYCIVGLLSKFFFFSTSSYKFSDFYRIHFSTSLWSSYVIICFYERNEWLIFGISTNG